MEDVAWGGSLHGEDVCGLVSSRPRAAITQPVKRLLSAQVNLVPEHVGVRAEPTVRYLRAQRYLLHVRFIFV